MFEAGLLLKAGSCDRPWPRVGVPLMVPVWEAMSGQQRDGAELQQRRLVKYCKRVQCRRWGWLDEQGESQMEFSRGYGICSSACVDWETRTCSVRSAETGAKATGCYVATAC
jgi:hypothetical protein